MEGAVLAGKLAAEIVVDDALGQVQPSVYIYPKLKLYHTRRGTALSLYMPKTVPYTRRRAIRTLTQPPTLTPAVPSYCP